ncbi:hypothetical protein [Paraburkholderia bannensis]|uniref:hypothetical protein n=1 Tax=Paraburkholderia bannensis TaxID=765414 RepID=UPI002ABDADAD|nr:hypothetical protein [Paraburkholderia bannensis]
MNAAMKEAERSEERATSGNTCARHDSLMHVTVKTDRAQAVAARNIGKISC